jgi:twitching motility protein PilJ
MQVLREISTQTAEGSTATSTSVGKLAALSAQLRKSVAGFRLPDYGAGTTTVTGSIQVNGHATPGQPPQMSTPAAHGGGPLPPQAPSPGNSGKMRKASGAGARA